MKQITSFWTWFQNNEEAIKNALILGINNEQVFHHFDRNFNYISKRLGYYILKPNTESEKFTILFTAGGYRKLFPKLMALEEMAPKLAYFKAESFIKPIKQNDKENNSVFYENMEFQRSELQMALSEYNSNTKHLKIKIYLPNYDEIKDTENLRDNVVFIIMQIIGEIAYRRHIKYFSLHQLPHSNHGLLCLLDLPYYIDYLYKINATNRTRII